MGQGASYHGDFYSQHNPQSEGKFLQLEVLASGRADFRTSWEMRVKTACLKLMGIVLMGQGAA